MCFNHPKTIIALPGPWKNRLPRNWSLVPERLRTADVKYRTGSITLERDISGEEVPAPCALGPELSGHCLGMDVGGVPPAVPLRLAHITVCKLYLDK